MTGKYSRLAVPAALFAVALWLIPLTQFQGLALMPGDLGDARLNNYFLENIYRFFSGGSDSLWHLSFFFPFPYVLGFSDNLFGSSPAYLLARFFGVKSDTAFQLWFLFGYVANFSAAFYALRKLGGSTIAASIGALIFAFALPVTAHAGHAQLHYRFGIPLAVAFYFDFLDKKEWRALVISAGWLAWQFYAGVYIGFFTMLLMVAMLIAYLAHEKFLLSRSTSLILRDFTTAWLTLHRGKKALYLLLFASALCSMALLFYPYFQVSRLYGAKRSWDEISTMLPRPQSYMLSDASFLWANNDSKIFSGIPMRYEHQMFVGMMPLILAALGFLVGSRDKNGPAFTLIAGMLGVTIASTLYVGGFSLWYFFHELPLASAIRVMTRLDQVILFPVAYLAVIAIDHLRTRYVWGLKAAAALILPFMLLEFSMTSMGTSVKETWRQRIAEAELLVPSELQKNSIVFMAPRKGPFYADELDAMWVSLNRGVKTMNGYSGLFPPGYGLEHGNDCAAVPSRVLAYLNFYHLQNDEQKYKELISRIVPVGFEGCNRKFLISKPTVSTAQRPYSAEEIKHLSYRLSLTQNDAAQPSAVVKIVNSGDMPISARSNVGKPLRLSWRFLDASGTPLSDWDNRKDLPFDVPAKGELDVQIPLSAIPAGAVELQVSMVQELEFWAHNVGIAPVSASLK